MHLIKPQQLGLSFRPLEYKKRFGLSVSAYLYVPFEQSESGTLWAEASMWDFLSQEMSPPLIDEGVAKTTSEFLVHGFAYPHGDRDNAVAVKARLGTVEKSVLVFGDRYWNGNTPTPPTPFERMPLAWTHAYGGQDFPINPVGKGRQAADGVRWLPNLELPHSRIKRPQDDVVPAGFAALDVMHPQRAAVRGTYDETWLKEHCPGVPPDAKWTHFNVAPRDQWMPSALIGDEPFELHHMHPERPIVAGALPGLRVRVFANRQIGLDPDALKMREVSMRLTTVWFYPHAERMVLVFQGLTQTEEDDAFDVKHLMGAIERLAPDPDRTDAHYEAVFHKRTAGGIGAGLQALNDPDLLPPGIGFGDPAVDAKQAPFKIEGFKEDAEYRKALIDVKIAREKVRAQGKDPDALGLRVPPREKPPKPEEMGAYIEKLIKDLEEQEWKTLDSVVTALETAEKVKRDPKMADRLNKLHRGPPTFSARAELDKIEKRIVSAGGKFDRQAFEIPMMKAELVRRAEYQQGAHAQPPAHPLTGDAARERRAEIEWLLENGHRTLPLLDWTGADFSNLDLRGVDFRGAWLESVDFQGSNLSRAIFRNAVLAHADLKDVVAIGTDFNGANLGSTRLENARLDRADLTNAILMQSLMKDCSLAGATLTGTNWLESMWLHIDLSGAVAEGQLFHKLILRGCAFVGAKLSGSNFIECVLTNADFRQAELKLANFLTCTGERAHFAGAQLETAVFAKDCRLERADFSGANLKGANFGGSDFSGSRFREACLDGANLTRARLNGCDARRTKAIGAMLRKGDYRGSNWSGTDFKDAILQGADFRQADLRDTHLFGADLSRVRLDDSVRFEGAEFDGAKIHPRRRPRETDPAT